MTERLVAGYVSDRKNYRNEDVITNSHTHEEEPMPITDDASNIMVWTIISGVSLLAIMVLILIRKTRN